MSSITYNDMTIGEVSSFIKNKIKELTTEQFTLYPFQEIQMEIPPEYKKYNFNQREAYDVLDDFDKPPDKLTDNQKVLRKKYLNIVLALMDKFSVAAKEYIAQMIDNEKDAQQREGLRQYALGNYDPAFNTIKRVINLLIKELDPNTTTACTPTPCTPTVCDPPVNKTPFIITISVLSIFLVIMIIIIIYLGISRSRSR